MGSQLACGVGSTFVYFCLFSCFLTMKVLLITDMLKF